MNTRYRGLNDEFRLYLDKRHGWPRQKLVIDLFRRFGGGYQSGQYNKLRHGNAVAEKYAAQFIDFALEPQRFGDAATELRHLRGVLVDFLRTHGVQSPSQVGKESILSLVCGPIADKDAPARSNGIDYLRRGIRAIGEFVHTDFPVDRYVLACQNEEEVHDAVHSMFLRVAHCVSGSSAALSDDEAIAIAEGYMQVSLASYKLKAAAWWRFNPWTVVQARQKETPVGVSIVLPLSSRCYDKVFKGEMAPHEANVNDFNVPSSHLIIEGCSERPNILSNPAINPTKPLVMTQAFQLAALSQCKLSRMRRTIKLLSFAGTPLNRERLLDTGFVVTGFTMPKTGLELFEMELPVPTFSGTKFLHSSLLILFGTVCDCPPPL